MNSVLGAAYQSLFALLQSDGS
ncbi:MAG: hypothetical protein QG587_170, partial [Chloroflexota bacterium]|nr:hypothetical protein [Chloroflexota bacterium]